MLTLGLHLRRLAHVRMRVPGLRWPHCQPGLPLRRLPCSLQIGLQLLIKADGFVVRHLGRLVLFAQHLHDGVHLCGSRSLEERLKVLEVPVCGQAPDAGAQASLIAGANGRDEGRLCLLPGGPVHA